MNRTFAATAAIAASMFALASAQTTGSEVQRNANQQERIEQGLKSGSLSTGEAAKLEKGEAKVDRMEAKANKDGTLTDAEKARIQKAHNKESSALAKAKTNDQTGNPNSASSQRMQADVQRNANQEQRIENGVKSGSLTNREAGNLERGQAKVDRKEAKAAANGHVGAGEQKNIQSAENHQSRRIHREKHNERKKD